MAWEEESLESGVDFEEVGGKKSKLKLILIVVGVLGLAAAGYFGYQKFMANDDPVENGDGDTAGGDNSGGDKSGANKAGANGSDQGDADQLGDDGGNDDTPGFKVDLEKFTINLSGPTSHYLVVTISLEVSTEALQADLIDMDDKKLYMVKTRSKIQEILRAKTYEEVKESDFTLDAEKEIRNQLRRIYKTGKVKAVYFPDILID